MAQRVFLHIGAMKSATTYLQNLLDRNVETLAEAGFLWQTARRNFAATGDLIGSRHDPEAAGAWSAFAQEIRQHPGDVVVSNELLAALPPKRIGRVVAAFEPAEVHVVLTVRDLARVIPSQWQTGTRNRQTETWQEFFNGLAGGEPEAAVHRKFWAKQDVADIVRRWSRKVSRDHIVVVTVPSSGTDPAVLAARFGEVFGVDTAGFRQPRGSNPSLGAHSAELMRRLNLRGADLTPLQHTWAYKNGLARRVLAQRAGEEPQVRLSREQWEWSRERSRRMVEEVKGLGVAVIGDLSDLVPGDFPGGEAYDPSSASDADLLAAAESGLDGLARLYADLRIEQERVRRRRGRGAARAGRRSGSAGSGQQPPTPDRSLRSAANWLRARRERTH